MVRVSDILPTIVCTAHHQAPLPAVRRVARRFDFDRFRVARMWSCRRMRCASPARRLPSRRCARRTCLRPQQCSRQVSRLHVQRTRNALRSTGRARAHSSRAQALRAFHAARIACCGLASVGRRITLLTPPAGRTPLRDGSSTPGSVHGSVHGSIAGRSVAGTTTPRVARDEFSINTDDSDDMLGGRHRDVEQQVRPVRQCGGAVERRGMQRPSRAERCTCTCRAG